MPHDAAHVTHVAMCMCHLSHGGPKGHRKHAINMQCVYRILVFDACWTGTSQALAVYDLSVQRPCCGMHGCQARDTYVDAMVWQMLHASSQCYIATG